MKVCDRHPRTEATDHISLTATATEFDLCEECSKKIHEFMGQPKREEVEEKPKKRGIFGRSA